jgi:hypothetical protein
MRKLRIRDNPYKWVNLSPPIYGEVFSYIRKTPSLYFFLVKLLSIFKEKNVRKNLWICRLWH